MLVAELRGAGTQEMTTGIACYPSQGQGRGWGCFTADSPGATVTGDGEAACIPCHIPARDNDWVSVRGPLAT